MWPSGFVVGMRGAALPCLVVHSTGARSMRRQERTQAGKHADDTCCCLCWWCTIQLRCPSLVPCMWEASLHCQASASSWVSKVACMPLVVMSLLELGGGVVVHLTWCHMAWLDCSRPIDMT
jgi:hypothetical protein